MQSKIFAVIDESFRWRKINLLKWTPLFSHFKKSQLNAKNIYLFVQISFNYNLHDISAKTEKDSELWWERLSCVPLSGSGGLNNLSTALHSLLLLVPKFGAEGKRGLCGNIVLSFVFHPYHRGARRYHRLIESGTRPLRMSGVHHFVTRTLLRRPPFYKLRWGNKRQAQTLARFRSRFD